MFTHDSYAGVYLKNHHLRNFAKIGSQLDHSAVRSVAAHSTKHAPVALRHLEAVTSMPQARTEQGLSSLLAQLQDPFALLSQALAKYHPEQALLLQAVQAYTAAMPLAPRSVPAPAPAKSKKAAHTVPTASATAQALATATATVTDVDTAAASDLLATEIYSLVSGTSATLAAAGTASQAYPNVSVCFTTADSNKARHQSAAVALQGLMAPHHLDMCMPITMPLSNGHMLSPSIYNPVQMQARSSLNVAPAYLAHVAGSFKPYAQSRAPLAKCSLVDDASGYATRSQDGAGCCHQDTSAYASTLAKTLGVRNLSVNISYAAKPLLHAAHDLKLAPLCRQLGAAYPNDETELASQLVAVDLQNFAQAKTTDIPTSHCGSLGHLQHDHRSLCNQKRVLNRAQLGVSGGISFGRRSALFVTESAGPTRLKAAHDSVAEIFEPAFAQKCLSDAQPTRGHLASAETISDHVRMDAATGQCTVHNSTVSGGLFLQAKIHRADADTTLHSFYVAKSLSMLQKICCVELNPLDQVLRCLMQSDPCGLTPLSITAPSLDGAQPQHHAASAILIGSLLAPESRR